MKAIDTRWRVLASVLSAMLGVRVLAAPEPEPELGEFFRTRVHPLLEAKCFGCHGEEKDREGSFDMRTRAGLLAGGESGQPSLVPGSPERSLLFQAVLRQGELKMPPRERNKLSESEIQVLREWILAGAPWPENHTPNAGTTWDLTPEDVWAFQPRAEAVVPQIRSAQSKTTNPIDAFIFARLAENNLQPAPPADRDTLLRRAPYDLIGLPPTPEEIDAFTNDQAPDAFDKVIERLLASPHYGERMARHWLDVVRYADTDGFSNDYERPNAWRYRDYVIRSFNADKPYNDFIVEQIAGDELVDAARSSRNAAAPALGKAQDLGLKTQDAEKLIAIGMLRMGPWEHTAMSVAAVTRQLFLDDVTHSVGTTFLGLTVACAKCHDHKFDPIPTKDYYALQSVFAPAQFETRPVPFLANENTRGLEEEIARVQTGLEKTKARLADIRKKRERAVQSFLAEKGVRVLRDLPASERPQKDYGLTAADMGAEKVLRKRVEYYERELQRFKPMAYSISSGGLEKPVPTPRLNVLIGGSIEAPGDPVDPGVLMAVVNRGRVDNSDLKPSLIPESDAGRRLALARWIASAENPLAARVMINRVWQWHFGKGLVETPNNFGKMGGKPAHPELLDWLANYFVERNWSVKEMHRLIMRSATYQQSVNHPEPEKVRSADPDDKLLARFRPRRLTAEELRDSLLAVSGELSATLGGPPVFPEINMEAAIQPRHIMGSVAPPYKPSLTREQRNRRTIYTVQIRSLMNPMLEVFNAPNTDNSCEARDSTTVAPQVFALFNSQFSHDMALAMADKIAKASSRPAQQIDGAYRIAYGRLPTQQERELCLAHLQKLIAHHRLTEPVAFKLPDKVTQPMIEELTGEPFVFEEDWDVSNYEYNLGPMNLSAETRALAELCLVLLNSNEFLYVY